MEDVLITVMTSKTLGEANIIKALLDSKGIQCFLRDENVGSMLDSGAAFGYVKIEVGKENFEKAKNILIENDYIKIHSPEENLRVEPCPNCSSRKIQSGKKGLIFLLLSALLFFIPVVITKKIYLCKDCDHTWHSRIKFEHIFWSVILGLFCIIFWLKIADIISRS